MENHILGIDIGATGMKGAIVDVQSGQLITERIKLQTPHPATPHAMVDPFMDLIKMHEWSGKIGCGFPAIVKNGVALTASNIDEAWIDVNIEAWFEKVSGMKVKVLNDADAAGMAEAYFGAGKGKEGSILLITIGSGLGSALIYDGQIVPNTELGHVYLKGHTQVAEKYASNNTRKAENLEWDEWGKRFNEFLNHIERIVLPDFIILGGGISKKFDQYKEYIDVDIPVAPAAMLNNAGIVGAALYAFQNID
jgi:polyphosphate glucokinase